MQTEIIQTLDQSLDLVRAEARLPRLMVGVTIAVTLVALAAGHTRFGAGFAFGAALAILNFRWLHQAIMNLFAAGQTRVPRRVIAKFALRYPLAFATLFLFYKTRWLPFPAILAGLFVPVGGVLIEGVIQIRKSFQTLGPGLGPGLDRTQGQPDN